MDKYKKRCINEDYLDLYTLCDLLNKDVHEFKNIHEFRHEIIKEIKDESNKLNFIPEIFSFCGPINPRYFFSQIYNDVIGNNNDKISVSLCMHGINIPNILLSDINCSCPLFCLKDTDELIFNNFIPVIITPDFSSFLYYEFFEYLKIYEDKKYISILYREALFREWLKTINLSEKKSFYDMFTYDIENMKNVKIHKFSMLSKFRYSNFIIKPWVPAYYKISSEDTYKSIKTSLLLAEEYLNGKF